jgi:HAMP domain-containing protein
MKYLSFIVLFLVHSCILFSRQADSAELESQIEQLRIELLREIRNVNQNVMWTGGINKKIKEEIGSMQDVQAKKTDKVFSSLGANNEKLDSVGMSLNQMQILATKNQDSFDKFAMKNYIFHFAAVAFILFLIFYIMIVRRKSTEFLLTRADNLATQNIEIIHKAEEIKKLRQSLEQMVNQQEKVVKSSKKKQKKAKKKKKK